MSNLIDLNRAARVAIMTYAGCGGKAPALAIFWGKDEWEVHVGNGRCRHVRLGEIDGEIVGKGGTPNGAFADLMTQLQNWKMDGH